MRTAIASDAYRAVAADEPNCMVGTKVIVAEQNLAVPVPPGAAGPSVKRMAILTRAPGVEPAAFRRVWRDAHAPLVARLPGLAGYTQNVVVDRAAAGGPAGYEAVPVDGMAELWFHDIEALHAAFAFDVARALEAHARAFMGTITAWRVEVHAVV